MRVFITLLGLTVVATASAAVFPGWARDFENQGIFEPVDAWDLVDEQVGEQVGEQASPSSPSPVQDVDSSEAAAPNNPVTASAPSRPEVDATLSPADIKPADEAALPAAVLPKPKLKLLPEVVKVITGEASWYGPGFYGNRTANGEVYRPGTMTAAHRSLPFGTKVRVTNLWNGRSAVIRINDRGPFVAHRVIDLGHGAASTLGLTSSGIANVKLEVLR